MKLIIEDTLYIDAVVDISSTDEDMKDTADEFNEIKGICDSYSINCMLDLREDTTIFIVYPQKVTLSEEAINDFFANVLFLFNYEIAYANLGGRGCEFSIVLTER